MYCKIKNSTCGLNRLYMCSLSSNSRVSNTPSASVKSGNASGWRTSNISLKNSEARGFAVRDFSSLLALAAYVKDDWCMMYLSLGVGGMIYRSKIYAWEHLNVVSIRLHNDYPIAFIQKKAAFNEWNLLFSRHFGPFVVGVWNLMRLFPSTSSRCVAIALKNRTNLSEIGLWA